MFYENDEYISYSFKFVNNKCIISVYENDEYISYSFKFVN